MCGGSRTLTGAWIETFRAISFICSNKVAPSRVRGLKPVHSYRGGFPADVAPSRVRGLKLVSAVCSKVAEGRTLTGAWIETDVGEVGFRGALSHPHGCVD